MAGVRAGTPVAAVGSDVAAAMVQAVREIVDGVRLDTYVQLELRVGRPLFAREEHACAFNGGFIGGLKSPADGLNGRFTGLFTWRPHHS
jgi:hypothetical protein